MAAGTDIEHTGRVQRIAGGRVYVEITSNSACASCRARKACGAGESAVKVIEVDTPSAADFSIGEEVVVGVRRYVGLRAVVFAYVGPLVVLVGLLAGVKAAGAADGAAAAASLAGVAIYYAVLWLLRSQISGRIRFTVRKSNGNL